MYFSVAAPALAGDDGHELNLLMGGHHAPVSSLIVPTDVLANTEIFMRQPIQLTLIRIYQCWHTIESCVYQC